MSITSLFSLFSSIRRRIVEKLNSMGFNKSRMKTVKLPMLSLEQYRSDVDYYYVELTYRSKNVPSSITNHIYKKFPCRKEVDEFIQYYSEIFRLIRIKRGVVLK